MWISCIILAILSAISLVVGAADVSWTSLDSHSLEILWQSRWPRLMAILLTGSSMAIAGLIMQQLSQNKFASPSTTGTIESASLGILVSMMLFNSAPILLKVGISFAFAIVGSWIFMTMLQHIVFKDALFIPLLGIMYGRVVAAVTTLIAYRYDLVQSLNSYLYGDFSGVLQGRYELLYVGVVAMILAYTYAHKFTIAGFGESFAHGLGLSYHSVQRVGLSLVAVITATVVLTVGEVPFIGLIVPNIITMIYGDNVRHNLPYVAVGGAIFVLLCDIIGRVVLYPFEISVSLIIGVIGGVSFLGFLLRRRYNG